MHNGLDDDKDVDGSPADDEGCHHHQDHTGDPPHVPVLLFGAREQADALQPQDHQTVADGDDQDGHHEGQDEHADFHHCVPVPVRFGKSESTAYAWRVKTIGSLIEGHVEKLI